LLFSTRALREALGCHDAMTIAEAPSKPASAPTVIHFPSFDLRLADSAKVPTMSFPFSFVGSDSHARRARARNTCSRNCFLAEEESFRAPAFDSENASNPRAESLRSYYDCGSFSRDAAGTLL
jgi:hypothetical protein